MTEQAFTFTHFIEPETLEARVSDLKEKWTAEEIAATAFYLGVLSVTGFSKVVPLHGDAHYLMHVMSNVFAGEWLTELIRSGSVDPGRLHEHALAEHGWALSGRGHQMEDIREHKDAAPPMDRETFNRLWGGHDA